jgi:outer membrane protein OmpA-like peptidoglycan-associated protein
MIKSLTAGAAMVLALTLAAPGHAQLFRGGLGGGGLGGGSLGGSLGGGLRGDLGGDLRGDLRVRGDVRTEPVRAPKVHAPKPPKVAPAVKLATDSASHAIAGRVDAAPGLIRQDTTHIISVPAIPDYAARRVAIYDAGIAPVPYVDAPAYIDRQYDVLRNDLRGTGVEVVRHGQQIVLEMPSDVTFAFNKYDIQPRFQPVLDAVAHTLSKYPATYVDVDGHTDAIGSQAYNQVLSERRADTVASYLAQQSVAPVRMHVEGFGKTEPIASNATVMGRAANRRVEIVLTPYVD